MEVSGTYNHTLPRSDRREAKIILTRIAITLDDSQRPDAPIRAETTPTSTEGHAELGQWLRPLVGEPLDAAFDPRGAWIIRGLDAKQTAAGHVMPSPRLQIVHLLFTDAGFTTLWQEAFHPDLHAKAASSADRASTTRLRLPVELPLLAHLHAEVHTRYAATTQPESAGTRRIDYAGPLVLAPPPPDAPPPQLHTVLREGRLTGHWTSAAEGFAIEHHNRRKLFLELGFTPPAGDPLTGMIVRQTRGLSATAKAHP